MARYILQRVDKFFDEADEFTFKNRRAAKNPDGSDRYNGNYALVNENGMELFMCGSDATSIARIAQSLGGKTEAIGGNGWLQEPESIIFQTKRSTIRRDKQGNIWKLQGGELRQKAA